MSVGMDHRWKEGCNLVEKGYALASHDLDTPRYVKRMAEEPCQSGYVDPDTPRGFGVFNPSNRVASVAAGAPAPKDGLNAPRPSATDRLPSAAPHVPRASKVKHPQGQNLLISRVTRVTLSSGARMDSSRPPPVCCRRNFGSEVAKCFHQGKALQAKP